MRTPMLDAVVNAVNGFHVRSQVEYDYQNIRRRLIFEALTQGVQYVINNDVEGDIAEFGTAAGFSAFTIARALNVYRQVYAMRMANYGGAPKTLHLFDSFQGLPRPEHAADTASPNVQSGRWKGGTYAGLTQEELLALCASTYDQDKIRLHPGWFADTLRTIPAGARFAMLHLDCDLYSSTFEVLDHLFARDHLADGCALFFDDWNCNRSSPRFGQRRAWREVVEKHRVAFSDCGDYAVLSHKFLIHAPG